MLRLSAFAGCIALLQACGAGGGASTSPASNSQGTAVAAKVLCWNGETSQYGVVGCPSITVPQEVLQGASADASVFSVSGVPSAAKLSGGELVFSPTAGGPQLRLSVNANGRLSGSSLQAETSYRYAGTITFENAPNKEVSGTLTPGVVCWNSSPQTPLIAQSINACSPLPSTQGLVMSGTASAPDYGLTGLPMGAKLIGGSVLFRVPNSNQTISTVLGSDGLLSGPRLIPDTNYSFTANLNFLNAPAKTFSGNFSTLFNCWDGGLAANPQACVPISANLSVITSGTMQAPTLYVAGVPANAALSGGTITFSLVGTQSKVDLTVDSSGQLTGGSLLAGSNYTYSGTLTFANAPSKAISGSVRTVLECWDGVIGLSANACTAIPGMQAVVPQGLASSISYTVSGLPSGAVLRGGFVTFASQSGSSPVQLSIASNGKISGGFLVPSSTYNYSGTMNFVNAPSKTISGTVSAFGEANPVVSDSAIATSKCGSSNLTGVSTRVGDFVVYPNDCVISLTLPKAEWDAINAGNGYFNQIDIAQKFSLAFKDSFDFLFIVLDRTDLPSAFEYYGVYQSLSARLPQRSRRLMGFTTLPYLFATNGFVNGIDGGPILHEILHEWGNRGYIPSSTDAGHWGFSSVGGQLGGFKSGTLQSLGGDLYQAKGASNTCLPGANASELAICADRDSWGTNANRGNSIPYSKFELFAMGLIDASGVPDVQYALGPAWSDSTQGKFTATSIQTLTAAQIRQASNGSIPATPSGQKAFRVASLVLTLDVTLSAASLTQIEQTLERFEYDGSKPFHLYGNVIWFHNFYTATGGLARIRVGGLLAERRVQ